MKNGKKISIVYGNYKSERQKKALKEVKKKKNLIQSEKQKKYATRSKRLVQNPKERNQQKSLH